MRKSSITLNHIKMATICKNVSAQIPEKFIANDHFKNLCEI